MRREKRVPPEVAEEVIGASLGIYEWCAVISEQPRRGEHLHHRLTRARGGPHDPHNLVHLCEPHHRQAHAENLWPWLVPGYILRGTYTGPDVLYRVVYNGEPEPSTTALAEEWFPDAPIPDLAWAVQRSRRWATAASRLALRPLT